MKEEMNFASPLELEIEEKKQNKKRKISTGR
jgi:hypothetical protein